MPIHQGRCVSMCSRTVVNVLLGLFCDRKRGHRDRPAYNHTSAASAATSAPTSSKLHTRLTFSNRVFALPSFRCGSQVRFFAAPLLSTLVECSEVELSQLLEVCSSFTDLRTATTPQSARAVHQTLSNQRECRFVYVHNRFSTEFVLHSGHFDLPWASTYYSV